MTKESKPARSSPSAHDSSSAHFINPEQHQATRVHPSPPSPPPQRTTRRSSSFHRNHCASRFPSSRADYSSSSRSTTHISYTTFSWPSPSSFLDLSDGWGASAWDLVATGGEGRAKRTLAEQGQDASPALRIRLSPHALLSSPQPSADGRPSHCTGFELATRRVAFARARAPFAAAFEVAHV